MPEVEADTGVRTTPKPAEETLLSVERAFAMVEVLSDASEGRSLAELAREFAINKAIAQRLLDTLEAIGIVWRDDLRQRWHLTYKISNLGLRQLQKGGLLDQCAATLKSLASATGELVRLAVVEHGEKITWVYAIAGVRRSVQIDPNYSLEIQLNTHAIAKAWLATMPFDEALRLIERQGAVALTRYSHVNVEELRADHAATAARGFAISFEEQELGVGAIAAPVIVTELDETRRCVGAVSLAAPTSRMNRAELEACAPALLATVAHLAETWPLADTPRPSALGAVPQTR